MKATKSGMMDIREASQWASEFLSREISPSNISYLIQYGKIKKHNGNGTVLVDVGELRDYYESYHGRRELRYKEKIGDDLNWALSFDHLREKDTTKHVHRLHPYKGKFIPQLVEYFLDTHTDDFKKKVFFRKGDVVLDPFSGSGTTLVQAKELGVHSVGIDISRFNCMITEAKLLDVDLVALETEVQRVKRLIFGFEADDRFRDFEDELNDSLSSFNKEHFPSPDFKYDVNQGLIEEDKYGQEKASQFLKTYNRLIKKYGIQLHQDSSDNFLGKWYARSVRMEIDYARALIGKLNDDTLKKVLSVVLSRTIRSCRATTHSDLATLKTPQYESYYCVKHKKICRPLLSIKKIFSRYARDTVSRLVTYGSLKTNAEHLVLTADSRTVNILSESRRVNTNMHSLLRRKAIRGIFTSPPYVGQIDYHEQHAYAYELLGFQRQDELEIGPLYAGQGAQARDSYVMGISEVLRNCRKFMVKGFHVFLVANDKFGLYPEIAGRASMKIVQEYKRPVLNRTERAKNPYSETIFHMRPK